MHAGSNPVTQAQKVCSNCKLSQDVDNFGKKSSAKDKLQSRCKKCQREKVNKHYADNRQYYKDKARVRNDIIYTFNRKILIEYLKSHCCTDCGNEDIEVLQFDHRDQSTKSGEVSNFLTCSTERLMLEVNKCDVRCANCHTKRTRRQLGWWVSE